MIQPKLDALLQKHGRSLYWLAKQTGYTYQALWNFNKRRTEGISYGLLDAICGVLNCQPGDVLVRVDDKKSSTRRK